MERYNYELNNARLRLCVFVKHADTDWTLCFQFKNTRLHELCFSLYTRSICFIDLVAFFFVSGRSVACAHKKKMQARYMDRVHVGSGAFGSVAQARDIVDAGHSVVLKTTKGVFNYTSERSADKALADARMTFHEVAILHAAAHPNIIHLRDAAIAKDTGDVDLVLDKMDTSLDRVLLTHQLTEMQQQYVVYQLASALHYLHSGSILHRDIKPGNVLIDQSCRVRLCDFGMSVGVHPPSSSSSHNDAGYRLERGVGTAAYFAPEQLVRSSSYGTPVDVWALGCIMAEMMDNKCLFYDKSEQCDAKIHWRKILALQQLSERDIAALRPEHPHLVPRNVVDVAHTQVTDGDSFAQHFGDASPLALDLLRRMLQVNPNDRITAGAILVHPYLAAFHDASNVRVCAGPLLNVADFGDRMVDRTPGHYEQTFRAIVDDMHRTRMTMRAHMYGYAYVPRDQIESVLSLGYLSVRAQVELVPQNKDAIRRRYATQYAAAKRAHPDDMATFESKSAQSSPPPIDAILKYLDWRDESSNGKDGAKAIYFMFAPVPDNQRLRVLQQRVGFLDDRILIRFPVPTDARIQVVVSGAAADAGVELTAAHLSTRDSSYWSRMWEKSLAANNADTLWLHGIPHGYFVPAAGRIDPRDIELVS